MILDVVHTDSVVSRRRCTYSVHIIQQHWKPARSAPYDRKKHKNTGDQLLLLLLYYYSALAVVVQQAVARSLAVVVVQQAVDV